MTGVESSTFVPRVESSSGRLAIPADLVQRIEHWSSTYGLSREEGAELVLRGSVEPVEEAALTLRAAYEARDVQTPEQVSAGLSAAEVDVPVVGMRLGPRRPITETEPFTRDHLGADAQRVDVARLGIDVEVAGLFDEVLHAYPSKVVRLRFYRCRLRAGRPRSCSTTARRRRCSKG